jgi:hypothetical protein
MKNDVLFKWFLFAVLFMMLSGASIFVYQKSKQAEIVEQTPFIIKGN